MLQSFAALIKLNLGLFSGTLAENAKIAGPMDRTG